MNGETPQAVLEYLRSLLEAERGPLAEALRPVDPISDQRDIFAPLLADGKRTGAQAREYGLLIESVLEGYLLHFARGRVVEPRDPDLRLLAGDFLYAFGLARLARIGDLDAVNELADVISLSSQAHALADDGSEHGAPWRLTAGVWAAGVLAIAYDPWPDHEHAKSAVRAEGVAVSEHLIETALTRASVLGVGVELDRALIAFGEAVDRRVSPQLRPSPYRWRTKEEGKI